jgi:hypothetical protein
VAKGWCNECDQLVGISTTGQPLQTRDGQPVGSARWWRLDLHAKDGKVCDGSGKKI